MADFAPHVAVVRQNSDLIGNVLATVVAQHPDWVVTVAFYTALHMVEAMFYHDLATQHTHDHKTREQVLVRTPRYSKLYHHYRVLYSKSRLSRYLQLNHPGTPARYAPSFIAHCPPHTIIPNFINTALAGVRAEAEAIINVKQPGFTFPTVPVPPPPPTPPVAPGASAAGVTGS